MFTIKLPSPLPTSHQDLIDLFQTTMDQVNAHRAEGTTRATREDIASIMPPKVNMAVMLAAMNYQVENGGWKQWYGNDYWREGSVIVPFLKAAADLGVEGAEKLHTIVASAVEEITEHDNSGSSCFSYTALDDDDNDVERCLCDAQDLELYAIEDRLELYQTLLDRFNDINDHRTALFFSGGMRAAA